MAAIGHLSAKQAAAETRQMQTLTQLLLFNILYFTSCKFYIFIYFCRYATSAAATALATPVATSTVATAVASAAVATALAAAAVASSALATASLATASVAAAALAAALPAAGGATNPGHLPRHRERLRHSGQVGRYHRWHDLGDW